MVPWYQGGHADPWNHVEATMALAAGGRWAEVERAFDWLASKQLPDGSWCTFYLPTGSSSRGGTPTCAPTLPPARGGAAQLSGSTAIWRATVADGRKGDLRGACVTSARAGKSRGRWAPTACPAQFALLAASSSLQHSLCLRGPGGRAPSATTGGHSLAGGGGPGGAKPSPARPEVLRPQGPLGDGLVLPGADGAVVGDAATRADAGALGETGGRGPGRALRGRQGWVTAAETAECAMAAARAGLRDGGRRAAGLDPAPARRRRLATGPAASTPSACGSPAARKAPTRRPRS